MDSELPTDSSGDRENEPKNASIDLRTLLKGDLLALLTGIVYSVTTLPLDKSGKSASALCFFTVIAIGIFRIGSSFVDLRKKWKHSLEGTHYEALQTERRHHIECRETNSRIYAKLAKLETDFDSAIQRVEERFTVENVRLKAEFDAYANRHEHEYETLRIERDSYKAGYNEMVSDLRNSRGNQSRNPDSDPKASVYDAGQGGNPGSRG